MRYRNIAEAVSQLGLGLACQIIQRLCDLCAGQCLVRAKRIRLVAGEQTVLGDVIRRLVVPCVRRNVGIIGNGFAFAQGVADLVAVNCLEAVPVVLVLLLVSGALDGILVELDDGEYLLILFIGVEIGGVVRTSRNVLVELIAYRTAGR